MYRKISIQANWAYHQLFWSLFRLYISVRYLSFVFWLMIPLRPYLFRGFALPSTKVLQQLSCRKKNSDRNVFLQLSDFSSTFESSFLSLFEWYIGYLGTSTTCCRYVLEKCYFWGLTRNNESDGNRLLSREHSNGSTVATSWAAWNVLHKCWELQRTLLSSLRGSFIYSELELWYTKSTYGDQKTQLRFRTINIHA